MHLKRLQHIVALYVIVIVDNTTRVPDMYKVFSMNDT